MRTVLIGGIFISILCSSTALACLDQPARRLGTRIPDSSKGFPKVENALLKAESEGIFRLNRALHLKPGQPIKSTVFPAVNTFHDIDLEYDPHECDHIGQLIADGQLLEAALIIELLVTNPAPPETGKKKISLLRLLRRKTQRQIGRFESCDGPNCFQAAFNFHGDYPRESPPEAQMAFLKSEYELIPRGSEIRFGDVIEMARVHPDGLIPIHIVVYISPDLLFQKFSLEARSPYEFMAFDSLFEYYRVLKARHMDMYPRLNDSQLPLALTAFRRKRKSP